MKSHVAVVTRTKDRAILLDRAIQSVLNQTYQNWTHVIVNDGGNQHCVEELLRKNATKYAGRIKLIHNDQSHGMEAASNIGIKQCDSDYILIHDDDDSLEPRFLEASVAYLDSPPYPTVQGVVTMTSLVTERIAGNQVEKISEKLFRSLDGCLSAIQIAEANRVPPISFLFKRTAYLSAGPFDESLPVLGDWDYLLRFIAKFDIGVIKERLANYHLRSDSSNMTNSIMDPSNRFSFYEGILRNRMLRDNTYNMALASALQQGFPAQRLRRLYEHPFIGGFIRTWARFVNSSIPKEP